MNYTFLKILIEFNYLTISLHILYLYTIYYIYYFMIIIIIFFNDSKNKNKKESMR